MGEKIVVVELNGVHAPAGLIGMGHVRHLLGRLGQPATVDHVDHSAEIAEEGAAVGGVVAKRAPTQKGGAKVAAHIYAFEVPGWERARVGNRREGIGDRRPIFVAAGQAGDGGWGAAVLRRRLLGQPPYQLQKSIFSVATDHVIHDRVAKADVPVLGREVAAPDHGQVGMPFFQLPAEGHSLG